MVTFYILHMTWIIQPWQITLILLHCMFSLIPVFIHIAYSHNSVHLVICLKYWSSRNPLHSCICSSHCVWVAAQCLTVLNSPFHWVVKGEAVVFANPLHYTNATHCSCKKKSRSLIYVFLTSLSSKRSTNYLISFKKTSLQATFKRNQTVRVSLHVFCWPISYKPCWSHQKKKLFKWTEMSNLCQKL